MSERIAPEVAQRLVDEATPGPWRVVVMDCGDYDGEHIVGSGDSEISGELKGVWRDQDLAIACSAHDLAHTVVLQATEIAALRAKLNGAYAQIDKLSHDDMEPRHGILRALEGRRAVGNHPLALEVQAALETLRRGRDTNAAQRDVALAFADEVRSALGDGADEQAWPPGMTAADAISALRADLAAARVGVVTVEEHARAVREAFLEGRSSAPEDYWASSPRERNVDIAWRNSSSRDEAGEALRAAGLSDADAVALADGGGE